MQVAEFKWAGGHPGIDHPQITLEVEQAGEFNPVLRLDGRLYDDSDFEMLVHYDGECNRQNCTNHAWRVSWEERKDFTVGRYRLSVNGQAQVAGKIEDYTVLSQVFELTSSHALRTEKLSITDGVLSGRVRYPEAIRFDSEGTGTVNGHLLRSPWSPAEFGAPFGEGVSVTISATITAAGGPSAYFQESVALSQVIEDRNHIKGYDDSDEPIFKVMKNQINSRFSIPLSILDDLSLDNFVISLSVSDAYGNSGTHTATVTR
jgi:hypothetical protein